MYETSVQNASISARIGKRPELESSELENMSVSYSLPFQDEVALDIEIGNIKDTYRAEMESAGPICVFYICKLPFIQC